MPQTKKVGSLRSGRNSNRLFLFALAALVAGALIVDLLFAGNIQYYSKWARCGSQPVSGYGSGYLNDGAIHYQKDSAFPSLHSSKLFCTPLEAEKAGYSANPDYYDFPNLRQQRES
ncbi:MAG TPA: hypothetical protein VL362_00255 [Patescibacteria group bacterium]|jgi:hypothetical protein|nr:hypothetical protein [Patescibacteria group bacterium]